MHQPGGRPISQPSSKAESLICMIKEVTESGMTGQMSRATAETPPHRVSYPHDRLHLV